MDEVLLTPATGNKDLIESYDFATLRNAVGLYGQRLLLRLIEAANATGIIEGLDFKNGDCKPVCPSRVESDLFGHTRIIMPKTAIMGRAEEYSKVTSDIETCMRHIIKYPDKEGNMIMFPFLTYAKCGSGAIELEVREELWKVMLNFTKGFRKFQLDTALAFKSKYSLKLYQLISGQTEPLTYSLADLKEILGARWTEQQEAGTGKIKKIVYVEKETYPLTKDFIRRVIEPAKAEMDKCSPYTFDYELLYSRKSKAGRPAITAIRLKPLYQNKFRDTGLEANELATKHAGAFAYSGLSKEVRDILVHKFGLTDKGIKNNYRLWEAIRKEEKKGTFSLLMTLDRLAKRASKERPDNLPRFVIGTLKAIMKDLGIKV